MTDRRCPHCGRDVPPDSPGGLCPSCLIEQAVPEELSPTTPSPARFVPPSPEVLAPRFPQLEILELIGHGGMGAVYKARQSKLDRVVALKIIRPESADDPAFAERFNREARTLARLNHPGIVSVYDFGEVTSTSDRRQPAEYNPRTQTLYYFVMEYVDGVNLRQLLDDGRLPPEQALAIVPQVCEALQYAHEEGIIHRDVKPENILLDSRGRVKIADFGLAKLSTRSEQDFTLTGTYQVMGTPRYMAPEQMERSHTVDHRADIYSLGVVFYEMLTGQVPAGHFEPPSKQSNVDVRLDEVVLRALARDPARRYQQASDISRHVKAISGMTSDAPVGVPPVSAPLPGPSTILDRAISRIVGEVRGGAVGRGLAHPNTPGLVAILLALGLVTTVFLPWGLDLATATTLQGGVVHGYDYAISCTVGVVGFLLAIILFAAGTTHPIPRWRAWLILLGGAAALGLVVLFTVSTLPHSNWRVEGAFFPALGLCIALIVVGAWDMRRLPDRSPDQLSLTSSAPRVSRKAIVGACLLALSGLALLVMATWGLLMLSQMQASGGAVSAVFLLFPALVIVLPAAVAGTILGWIAIHDIRRSGGTISGLPLAVVVAIGFPLLVANGAILATLVYLKSAGLKLDMPLAIGLAICETALLGGWLTWDIVRRVWRYCLSPACATDDVAAPQDAQRQATSTAGDSGMGGRDWVTLTREQVEADDLPDVCMVCGATTTERVSKDFSFQPEWAQVLTLLGMCLFVFPGMIIESLTSRQQRIACPVCPRHRNHWSKFVWWASTGWLIPVLLGAVGFSIGWAVHGQEDSGFVGVAVGGVLGVIVYVVPLIRMGTTRIDVEILTDTEIRLKRVSAEFARQASRYSSATDANTGESVAGV